MARDRRSRNIVLVAHCLLNQNAKVQGLAGYSGVFEPVIDLIRARGAGIIQLPCPELIQFGLHRPLGTDTRDQYNTPAYRKTCRLLVRKILRDLDPWLLEESELSCVLGVEGSPSCSVSQVPVLSPDNHRVMVKGMGIFMKILSRELLESEVRLPFIGIPEWRKAGNLEKALAEVASCLPAAAGKTGG